MQTAPALALLLATAGPAFCSPPPPPLMPLPADAATTGDGAVSTSTLPPAPLACLQRWYAVKPTWRDGAWFVVLPDGRSFPYQDGREKSFEERLDHPDVEDVFSQRYAPGAIRPVTTPDDDPGRIRLDPLFQTTYTRDGLTKIQFLGHTLTVHSKVAPAFARVATRLERAQAADPSLQPYLKQLGGTFNPRNIAGTNRPSAHSYGVSIDINDKLSHYWRWQKPAAPIQWANTVPQAIVDAFEAEGFIWGGRWYHYDTMHFEYRPELLDAGCYPSR